LSELAAGLAQDEPDTFFLRARGSAMQDALLQDGDMVVVKRGSQFADGEMVAVYFHRTRRTTLRYFYRENGRVRAQSPNPDAPPEYFRLSEIEIRGTVLALVRKQETQITATASI
jgi:repressor LexA